MSAEDLLEEVFPTGNPYVDSLIFAGRWIGPISYSFPTSAAQYAPAYGAGEPLAGFAPVSALVMDAVRAIMSGTAAEERPYVSAYGSFASIIAVDIVATTPADGEFRFAVSALPDTAYAYLPIGAERGEDGDTWFGTAGAGVAGQDFAAPYVGGYAWFTILHELGHAFGLKHSHEDDGIAGEAVPADRDAVEFTLMSYRSYVGADLGETYVGYTLGYYDYPSTLMMEDIRALQTMYGADYSEAANNGDTRYRWDPATGEMTVTDAEGNSRVSGLRGGGPDATAEETNRVFMTIWDGGGHDVYDLSNYATDLRIDLQPGHWSVLSQAQRADLDLLNPGTTFAQGNVYNAYDFGNDGRGLIENAIGGSGNDSITGNTAANLLTGNDGNDSLDGGGGDDTLIGGLGADAMFGGDGIDLASYALSETSVVVIAGYGYTGEAEGDVLLQVENLIGSRFADYLGGDNLANAIDAGAGDDTVLGFGGDDTTHGGEGADLVYGMDGDDMLDERGDLSAAFNLLFGDDGDDLIYGSGGNTPDTGTWDYLAGGNGDDTIVGSAAGDWLFGDMLDYAGLAGSGNDSIDGAGGDDQILGGEGNDTLVGGAGIDVLYGGAGNDLLLDIGDTSFNVLAGGDGQDTLEGGLAGDYLVGGSGGDLFRFRDGNGADRIADFEVGLDRIGIVLTGGMINGIAIDSADDLLVRLVTVGSSTVLVLGIDDTVEFINVAQASLTANDFMLV